MRKKLNIATVLFCVCCFFLFPAYPFKGGNNEQGATPGEDKKEFVKTIDVTEKSLAFSRYATPGKISVFIMGAHWCAPCKSLKEEFEAAFADHTLSTKDVDVYYCLVSKSNNENLESINKRKSYQHFKQIDNMTAVFPTTYICTPTTNCYAIIKGAETDKIFGYVDELIELKRKYFTISALNYGMPKKGEKETNNNQALLRLERENDSLRNENSRLQEELDSMQ